MIISASRRTDIPAFHGEWFYNRLLDKQVVVKNPMNPKQLSTIDLSPENVDCIVFWTKNPKNFMRYLPQIDNLGYKNYFQFTLNAYETDIEKDVGSLESRIETFIELSKLIGKEKVIWRYDPILLNKKYTIDYHAKQFEKVAIQLAPFTEKCVISFIDSYSFLKNIFHKQEINELHEDEILELSAIFSKTLANITETCTFTRNNEFCHKLKLATCSEKIDLSHFGISHNKCIDDELISRITGTPLNLKKDTAQRLQCGCVKSRDIGTYNTCGLYSFNFSDAAAKASSSLSKQNKWPLSESLSAISFECPPPPVVAST